MSLEKIIIRCGTPDYVPTKSDLISYMLWVKKRARGARDMERQARHDLRAAKRMRLDVDESTLDGRRTSREIDQHIDAVLTWQGSIADLVAKYGECINAMAPLFDQMTTLRERCDVLGVNDADRPKLADDDGLVTIVLAHGFEDSATHRGQASMDTPMFNALHAVMRQWMDTPAGKKATTEMFDEALRPGGLFYGLPTYRMQANGSMLRQSAPLTVHDESGSRVVHRKPGQ